TLSGTLPADGHLCVSTNPNLCDLYPAGSPNVLYGGQFTSIVVPVSFGNQNIVVQAEDAAGNFSAPISASVYVISPPVVAVNSPASGASVTPSTVPFDVSVSPAAGDSSSSNPAVGAGSAITEVMVCVGTECAYACGANGTPCTGGTY